MSLPGPFDWPYIMKEFKMAQQVIPISLAKDMLYKLSRIGEKGQLRLGCQFSQFALE